MEEINNINDENYHLINNINKNDEDKKSKDSLLNILQMLEKDIIIKNRCQNEFNLKDDNTENYERTEIFGNPICFICSTNKKIDSSIQIFYCSHCNKLFCRGCLSFHYDNEFKNITEVFVKYIKDGRGEIMEKNIPKKISFIKIIFLFLFLIIFNISFLSPIFTMKTIISTYEEIIFNCVKKVLTPKVKNPDELFNFYRIYLEKSKKLYLDFDLMMIMNWLGDKILESFGFISSSFIFIVINSINYILLSNFNFVDYNRSNKYSFIKFLQLAFIYIMLFIGLGSFSLLSQRISIELNKKYYDYRLKLKEEKEVIKQNIIDKKNKLDNREELNKKNTKLQAYLIITFSTIIAYFYNFTNNLNILDYYLIKDEKSVNETNKVNNAYNENSIVYININTSNEIKEIDTKMFVYYYLGYNIVNIIISILFFWIMISCCFMNNQTQNNTVKKIMKEEKPKDKILKSIDIYEKNSIELTNENDDFNNINNNSQETSKSEITEITEIIEKKDYSNSYTMCKICGYFYFSEKISYRGDISCIKKFLYWIRDFFVLNINSIFDCCNITFCNVLNAIFCDGEKVIRCKCCCYHFNKKEYNKVSESFCYFYKEKRKFKWLHDYITSKIQKEIFPYVLDYFLLGLVIIAFQNKYNEFEYDFESNPNKKNTFNFDLSQNIKRPSIFLFTFFGFLFLSGVFGSVKLKAFKVSLNESNIILNGIHGILTVNCLISLFLSILHFLGKDLGDYILIPILIYKFYYFTLNYYCLGLSEYNETYEFILTGAILFSIYIKIRHFFYDLLINSIENEILYIIQTAFSGGIILFYTYYLFFSRKYLGLRDILCNNYLTCNFCGFCVYCCDYNTYCMDGYCYCDCCCCDEDSCCYCKNCNLSCQCCSCISKDNNEDYDNNSIIE